MSEELVIKAQKLCKSYKVGGREISVLKDIDISLPQNRSLVVLGPSGCGKSTLLNILSLLDTPDSGSLELLRIDMISASRKDKQIFREMKIGFVFQSFHLVPELNVMQNVALPGKIAGTPQANKRAKELLEQLGLGERINYRPNLLSGGESQRVAVARALFHKPAFIFADEPTGNLDPETGHRVMTQLRDTVREHGSHLVLVTHNPRHVQEGDEVLRLDQGRGLMEAGA